MPVDRDGEGSEVNQNPSSWEFDSSTYEYSETFEYGYRFRRLLQARPSTPRLRIMRTAILTLILAPIVILVLLNLAF